ncbi:unnamed protein product [Mycena citricolor]|uniref:Uncharacterized protein n=1 Tax=Mycena citricolor TaxID=2018698 RepID=A0AAD2HMV2_9AGAR|nr:unnamed protein product [Mycena citricolor]CAK5278908.1 unnamed protein product [Mycena citricolor]
MQAFTTLFSVLHSVLDFQAVRFLGLSRMWGYFLTMPHTSY